jgi:curved DNA-binding protein CbpA
MSTVNLYDVLCVSSDATQKELQKGYRKLVKIYHPDRPTGDEELYELITHAYNILSNEDTRGEYDVLHKLSKQSSKSHETLKDNSKNYAEAQETSIIKKTEEEKNSEFDEIMNELDEKIGYDRGDTEKINQEDAIRIFEDMEMGRIQEDIEFEPEQLFEEGVKFNNNLFNAMWDAKHGHAGDIVPHSGNPNAWGGFEGDNAGYTGFENISDVYADDSSHIGVEGQNYSNVEFSTTKDVKITKEDLLNLDEADYTETHNKLEENYEKTIEQRLAEREEEDLKYATREMQDYNTDPNCGGYGIFKDTGVIAGSLAWDDDEDDIKKKYQKLLDLKKDK